MLLLTMVGVLAVYLASFLLSTTSDRPDHLDSEVLRELAAPACLALRTELDALPDLPSDATLEQRRDRVVEQEQLVGRFVEQIGAVGDAALDEDEPARAWLADWQTLITIRQDYAEAGFTGEFAIPVEDGQPITRRMNDIGVDACEVPPGLLTAP